MVAAPVTRITVVPHPAAQQQLGRQSVYVVGNGDTVTAREVKGAGWSGDW